MRKLQIILGLSVKISTNSYSHQVVSPTILKGKLLSGSLSFLLSFKWIIHIWPIYSTLNPIKITIIIQVLCASSGCNYKLRPHFLLMINFWKQQPPNFMDEHLFVDVVFCLQLYYLTVFLVNYASITATLGNGVTFTPTLACDHIRTSKPGPRFLLQLLFKGLKWKHRIVSSHPDITKKSN